MCQANGKLIAHWFVTNDYKRYTEALSASIGIPIDGIVISKPGQPANGGGTWIHPRLAIKLARWCSVEFEIWCDDHIKELIDTGSTELPHYSDNWLCPNWNKARTIGKGKRLTLTGETKAWIERREAEGVKFTPAQKRKIYAGHSDALNLGVYDRTAKDLRATLGIKPSANLRDYFSEDEIGALQTVEEAAAWLIHSKDMHPIEAIKRVIELIEYRRRFAERHLNAITPKKTKRLKETERQLSLF